MAITKTGTFAPMIQNIISNDRSEVTNFGGKTTYKIDYRYRKGYPNERIKWCRRNMGERGVGWDFMWISELLVIEIWDDKLKFMYEMWKN